MTSEIRDELDRIGNDRASGATALVLRGIAVLRSVSRDRDLLRETARVLWRRQPSMAGFRTAAALVLVADDPARELDTLAERLGRSSAAIARFAAPLVRVRRPNATTLRVVTCSRSAVVEHTLREIASAGPLSVVCAESRPAREGVALAQALSAAKIKVLLYSDAGIGAAIPDADAVVVGADAVAESGFMNKVGTAALAALARVHGIPVLVLAGREKVLPEPAYQTLAIVKGPSAEIAPELGGASVENPYFERIPIELMSQLVTDEGPLPPADVAKATSWTSAATEQYMRALAEDNLLDTD